MKKTTNIYRIIRKHLNTYFPFLLLLFFLSGFLQIAQAEDSAPEDLNDQRIEKLENVVKNLLAEIEILKKDRKKEKSATLKQEKSLSELKHQVKELDVKSASSGNTMTDRFSFGGYGEVHGNFTVDGDKDLLDIHRLVLYLGYDFSKWIKFHSEIEIEHAFVSDSHDGEMGLEQAYVDFLINDSFNIRTGRILTPLGIINAKHEPPIFNGVERPSFSKYIIPSTWSADGVGIFGRLSPYLQYEAYVVGGLDGSGFNAKNGIRGGRIKDRPSLNDISFTGRMDFYPLLLQQSIGYEQQLRMGVSLFYGGLNNGSNGNNPGIDGDIAIIAGDFEYSRMNLDFRGAIALENVDGAQSIGNGTASEIFGWYLETGYHFWPDTFKHGLLKRSDAVVFVRYDDYDTQHKMPSGVAADPAGNRSEWTLGINFYPIPNFVIKADYQVREDGTTNDPNNLFNLGIGWQF